MARLLLLDTRLIKQALVRSLVVLHVRATERVCLRVAVKLFSWRECKNRRGQLLCHLTPNEANTCKL